MSEEATPITIAPTVRSVVSHGESIYFDFPLTREQAIGLVLGVDADGVWGAFYDGAKFEVLEIESYDILDEDGIRRYLAPQWTNNNLSFRTKNTLPRESGMLLHYPLDPSHGPVGRSPCQTCQTECDQYRMALLPYRRRAASRLRTAIAGSH